MSENWYALRSKPRKEDVVWRQMRAHEIEVFYPRLRVQPVNPRSKKVKPYFPGYLFVYVDIDKVGLSTFKWMPHAIGIVTVGEEPGIVPDNMIYAIRKRVEDIAAAGGELFDGLQPGDEITISDGPFAGYEAIFDTRVDGNERVRVLLQFLNDRRQVSIELDAGQINKKK